MKCLLVECNKLFCDGIRGGFLACEKGILIFVSEEVFREFLEIKKIEILKIFKRSLILLRRDIVE